MANKQGDFIWYELCTDDADGAEAFYTAVLNWELQDSGTPDLDYRIVFSVDETTGDRAPVGAIMALTDDMKTGGARPVWLGYIAVDDVDVSVESIQSRGGQVMMPATDIPEVGRIALLADPRGALFYVMRGIHDEPSEAFAAETPRVGHCAWNELMTDAPDIARTFYFSEFGWTKDGEMPMGPLGMYEFVRHGVLIGAIMRKPEEVPVCHWNYYFRVADIDTAVAAVDANGGTIVTGPDEIPGGEYTVLGFDPQGAPFALVGARTG